MPKYENSGKKIQFNDKISQFRCRAGLACSKFRPPGRPFNVGPSDAGPWPGLAATALMRLNTPYQVDFGHLVIVILQLMYR